MPKFFTWLINDGTSNKLKPVQWSSKELGLYR